MADISQELAAIMAAVKGEEVRGSIHDAIDIINKASEVSISSGTAINAGDPKTSQYFEGSLYINTSTDQLLRCGATNWQLVGSIRGNGIDEITGPVTSGLTDTYTIHYTDGETVSFDVTNGKGIVSVALYSQSGLIDTYRMIFNDDSYYDFSVSNGNKWYYGIAISGTSPVATGFVLPFDVKPGDSYLNISNDSIYHCVTGAVAGATSMWVYDFTITSTSTGTNNYNMLLNLPFVNNVEIKGSLTGHDLGLQDEANADAWLMDTSVTPAVPLEKPMAIDSTQITFSALEMSDINTNGWAVKAFFECPDGQQIPNFKKMIHNSNGSLDIYYSKVKAAQSPCKCKLRIVK